MNINIRFARIVTAQYTFIKYSFATDDSSGTARVLNPRTNETMAELSGVTVTELGPSYYRVAGTNSEGAPMVWTVDREGCQSCRAHSRVIDTEVGDIPT